MRVWLIVAFLMPGATFAATNATEDLQEYQASTSVSLKDGAGILAEPFGQAFAFSTGTQAGSPAAAKSLLQFNIGIGGGVNTTPIDKGSNSAASSLPDRLPLPLTTLNAHLGLPGFFVFESTDIGLRLGSISASSPEISANLSAFGAEFRGNVFEAGLVSPVTLTLGLSVDQLRSDLSFRKTATLNDIGGNGYTRTGTVQQGSDVNSSINATAIRAMVSRKFLFFTPYAGAAIQALGGETSISAFQKGSITSSNGGTPATASLTSEGKVSKTPAVSDVRLSAGFELSFWLLYFALGGEYGIQSAGSGGNAQLGLQF